MSVASELADNLARVRERIARAQQSAGVHGAVRIVAVTKGHPAQAVTAALGAGLEDVGENRVQEALDKQEQLPGSPARWHLIGHLQTNKAKFVPGKFALVHSVDSLKVADALAAAAAKHGARLSVLVQVNVAGEAQKNGCPPEQAADLAAHVAALATLQLKGLMTMAPFTEDVGVQRRVFGDLRRLRDQLAGQGLGVPELSMGMSGDYEAAVAEGATIVRLGTVLFGGRAA
jgi:hypothetical protein